MSLNRPDAILFDLDGTLWDTVSVCTEAWNRKLARLKPPHHKILDSALASAMGLAHDDLRANIFPHLSREEGMALLLTLFEEEVALIRVKGAKIYPGVTEGLHILSKSFKLHIVSNCGPEYLEAFLDVSRLRALFCDVECHGRTGLTKAENISLLIKRNQIQNAIYVGDTASDEASAKKAGVPFLFVEYGFGKCVGNPLRFKDFTELVKTILSFRDKNETT